MGEQSVEDIGTRPDFEIGLALAGAISAGAYTAGVLDFLFQALKAWEDEKSMPMPDHEVKLRTIAGASAGAITGALGVAALSRGLDPNPFSLEERERLVGSAKGPYEPTRCVLPSLYDAWVVRPCMVFDKGRRPQNSSEDARKDLLGLDDLAQTTMSETGIRSILNAALLDDIRDAALKPVPTTNVPEAGQNAGAADAVKTKKLGFLSETMHVYMTVSNLRGIPFDVDFGNATYGMLTHGDRIHYAVSGVGLATWAVEEWLAKDTAETISTADLPKTPNDKISEGWTRYGEVALASAAFPGGLAPRTISISPHQYVNRQYPLPVEIGQVKAAFPDSIRDAEQFTFVNVDGGVINNTPFDYVEYAVMGHKPEKRKTDGAHADRAVIMVAPFPEPPQVRPEGTPVLELAAVLRALFPTLINQARFRASELVPVMKENDHSRFMIAPRRTLDPYQGPARYPIACGLLGGFGGFLDEAFRAHDYQLGRRNCQRFLETTFGLPNANRAMSGRNGHYVRFPTYKVIPKGASAPEPEFMVVPLVAALRQEVALLPWPRMSGADFGTLMKRIERRLTNIRRPFIWSQTSKTSVRIIAWAGVYLQQDRILSHLALVILSDLVRRDQIAGWDAPAEALALIRGAGKRTEDLREIFAVLMSPARTKSTVGQIAKDAHLDEVLVAKVLSALERAPTEAPFRAVNLGAGQHTIQARLPYGWRSLPILRRVFGIWSPARYAAFYS